MKADVLIVTEVELKSVLSLNSATNDLIENAFLTLANGEVIMPPIMSMDIPHVNADVDVKTAYLPGLDGFAIKVSPGFFDNPKIGLPSLNGLMMLLSAKTGVVQAVFLDNGYLTDIRTASAGGVAARHLAPRNVITAGVVGTGVQARLQIQAAYEERKFEEVLVWGRNDNHAQQCAKDIEDRIDVKTRVVLDLKSLVTRSQLVVTTTPSREPLIDVDWLHPCLHITAMGSDQEGKGELDPAIVVRADKMVCDRISQCSKLGELRGAIEAGIWDAERSPLELGDVVAQKATGREDNSQITICDLTGTGAQDTAIANHASEIVRSNSIGTHIKTNR